MTKWIVWWRGCLGDRACTLASLPFVFTDNVPFARSSTHLNDHRQILKKLCPLTLMTPRWTGTGGIQTEGTTIGNVLRNLGDDEKSPVYSHCIRQCCKVLVVVAVVVGCAWERAPSPHACTRREHSFPRILFIVRSERLIDICNP